MSQLPPEVVIRVLESLGTPHDMHDTRVRNHTLRCCSLVNRHWHPIANSILYGSMEVIWLPPLAPSLVTLINAEPTLANLVDSLVVHFPRFWEWIEGDQLAKELVAQDRTGKTQEEIDEEVEEIGWDRVDEAGVDGYFGERDRSVGDFALNQFIESLPNLRRLDLKHFHSGKLPNLPLVSHLSLAWTNRLERLRLPAAPQLESLHLDFDGVRLVRNFKMPRVDSLVITKRPVDDSEPNSSDVDLLRQSIPFLWSSLRHLSLPSRLSLKSFGQEVLPPFLASLNLISLIFTRLPSICVTTQF
ncbi:hypothetical protein RQP46_002056 [Phenoliferia psychrophenolica]